MSGSQISSLGKYTIRGLLGKGAMGIVYDGWDPVIDRRVAIKTVRLPDAQDEEAADGLARFKREAQAAGRLTHPNIVGVFDYGETEELAYIVMEFVEGRSLKEMVGGDERMTTATTIGLMDDILAGLTFSHGRGVVHRDIKPANIMITPDGRAKIADFGIARIEASSMTQAGTVLGTPAYMSPEQFMGQVVDRRTDIYSCGVLLYQLLTGDRPFDGSMTAIMHKVLTTVPPRPSEIVVTSPVSLDGVVAKAMARRPEDRFDTAAEFAQALHAPPAEAFASDETVVAAPRPATARPIPAAAHPAAPVASPARSGKLPVIVGGGVGLAAIAAAVAWFVLPAGQSPAPSSQQASIAPQPTSQPSVSPPHVTSATNQPPPVPQSTPAVAVPAVSPSAVTRPPQTSAPGLAGTVPPTSAAPVIPPPVAAMPAPSPFTATPTSAPAPPLAPPTTVAPVIPAPRVPSSASASTSAPPTSPVVPSVGNPAPTATASVLQAPVTTAPQPVSIPATSPPASSPFLVTPVPPAEPPPPVPVMQPAAPFAPPPISAPTRSATAIEASLATGLAAAKCSLARAAVAADGRVTLSGVVGGGQPEDALRRTAADAQSAGLAWQVQSFDGPYCAALDVLRPLAEVVGRNRGGMEMGQVGGPAPLVDNAVIPLQVTMPGFAGFLHVAYLQHDATVAPQVPGPGYPSQTYAARAQIDLGTPRQDFEGWHVGPPFGTDMIVAVASTAPLFTRALPDSQPLASYLASLQAATDALRRRGGSVAAAAIVLDTRPGR